MPAVPTGTAQSTSDLEALTPLGAMGHWPPTPRLSFGFGPGVRDGGGAPRHTGESPGTTLVTQSVHSSGWGKMGHPW